MVRFLKGIKEAYSGKVGSVIGSSWRGVDYVRSLSKISNKKASEGQIAQRAKFAMAVAFLFDVSSLVIWRYESNSLCSDSDSYLRQIPSKLGSQKAIFSIPGPSYLSKRIVGRD